MLKNDKKRPQEMTATQLRVQYMVSRQFEHGYTEHLPYCLSGTGILKLI